MTGRLEGKVAFITGAARGQGRSHAVRLAEEGADIIAIDICAQIESVAYPMSTPDDLAETVRQVEALDRRIHAVQADVRDRDALQAALDAGIAQFGRLDIVLGNAGIAPLSLHPTPEEWQDVLDVNLTGVYHTVEISKQALIDNGGGAIVLTSSTAGLNGIGGSTPGGLGYTAAKHGIVGLMRSYANQLAEHSIRVNTVHPTGVNTPMVVNDVMQQFLEADPQMGQAMANALGRPVWAGPAEATAIGNLLVQLQAAGEIDSLAEGAALVAENREIQRFDPVDMERWQEAYEQYRSEARS